MAGSVGAWHTNRRIDRQDGQRYRPTLIQGTPKMSTTIQHLENELHTLEAAHAAAMLANDIGQATALNGRIDSLRTLLAGPERKASATLRR